MNVDSRSTHNLRPETRNDFAAIANLHTLAFQRTNEAELVERIRESDCYIPSLSLIAELDDQVVGHILFSYVDLSDQKVLSLAPIAVHPNWQKQGIGSNLIRFGLAEADKLNELLVVVLGDPKFYRRFGFEPSVQYQIRSPFEVPEEFFMVKPLTNYRTDLSGTVIYPAAFAQV